MIADEFNNRPIPLPTSPLHPKGVSCGARGEEKMGPNWVHRLALEVAGMLRLPLQGGGWEGDGGKGKEHSLASDRARPVTGRAGDQVLMRLFDS